MTLTQSAMQAFKKQRASHEAPLIQEAKSVATDFEKRFGTYVAHTDFDLDHARFTVEGMTFRYERTSNGWIYALLWFCPVCGKVSRSEYIHDLAGLGRWLSSPFKVTWEAVCSQCIRDWRLWHGIDKDGLPFSALDTKGG